MGFYNTRITETKTVTHERIKSLAALNGMTIPDFISALIERGLQSGDHLQFDYTRNRSQENGQERETA